MTCLITAGGLAACSHSDKAAGEPPPGAKFSVKETQGKNLPAPKVITAETTAQIRQTPPTESASVFRTLTQPFVAAEMALPSAGNSPQILRSNTGFNSATSLGLSAQSPQTFTVATNSQPLIKDDKLSLNPVVTQTTVPANAGTQNLVSSSTSVEATRTLSSANTNNTPTNSNTSNDTPNSPPSVANVPALPVLTRSAPTATTATAIAPVTATSSNTLAPSATNFQATTPEINTFRATSLTATPIENNVAPVAVTNLQPLAKIQAPIAPLEAAEPMVLAPVPVKAPVPLAFNNTSSSGSSSSSSNSTGSSNTGTTGGSSSNTTGTSNGGTGGTSSTTGGTTTSGGTSGSSTTNNSGTGSTDGSGTGTSGGLTTNAKGVFPPPPTPLKKVPPSEPSDPSTSTGSTGTGGTSGGSTGSGGTSGGATSGGAAPSGGTASSSTTNGGGDDASANGSGAVLMKIASASTPTQAAGTLAVDPLLTNGTHNIISTLESRVTGKQGFGYTVSSRLLDEYGDPITSDLNGRFIRIYDRTFGGGQCADTPILQGNVLSFSWTEETPLEDLAFYLLPRSGASTLPADGSCSMADMPDVASFIKSKVVTESVVKLKTESSDFISLQPSKTFVGPLQAQPVPISPNLVIDNVKSSTTIGPLIDTLERKFP